MKTPKAKPRRRRKKGLAHAGLAVLAVCFVWLFLTVDLFSLVTLGGVSLYGGNAPLYAGDPELSVAQNLVPFFSSLVAGFMILFIFAGIAYGRAAGTIKDHRDIVDMMAGAMKDMGYYLVLAFFAAYFVEMFNQSQLGLISAVNGANAIQASGLPLPIVLGLIVVFAAILNLFVGSASAKWALMAPVLVPMLMLLNVSPEMATAAYRVGDSATNIITPLMVYFPLVLVFARRWVPEFGIGSLTSAMIPYSIWLLIVGIAMTVGWVYLGLPLGPGGERRLYPAGSRLGGRRHGQDRRDRRTPRRVSGCGRALRRPAARSGLHFRLADRHPDGDVRGGGLRAVHRGQSDHRRNADGPVAVLARQCPAPAHLHARHADQLHPAGADACDHAGRGGWPSAPACSPPPCARACAMRPRRR